MVGLRIARTHYVRSCKARSRIARTRTRVALRTFMQCSARPRIARTRTRCITHFHAMVGLRIARTRSPAAAPAALSWISKACIHNTVRKPSYLVPSPEFICPTSRLTPSLQWAGISPIHLWMGHGQLERSPTHKQLAMVHPCWWTHYVREAPSNVLFTINWLFTCTCTLDLVEDCYTLSREKIS